VKKLEGKRGKKGKQIRGVEWEVKSKKLSGGSKIQPKTKNFPLQAPKLLIADRDPSVRVRSFLVIERKQKGREVSPSPVRGKKKVKKNKKDNHQLKEKKLYVERAMRGRIKRKSKT